MDMNDMTSMVKEFPQLLGSVRVEQDIQEICVKLGDEGLGGLCIIGMGGSAIAGQYVQALFQDVTPIPLITVRDSILPSFVNHTWATISVSYSGNTEETIRAFDESVKRGCHSFIVASNGRLSMMPSAIGKIMVPQSYQPRAAFPLLFSAILRPVECILGMSITPLEKIGETISKRSTKWEESPLAPKSMANDILDSVPLFIGSRHLIPVAYRAKCQMNENAKAMAFYSEIPESSHNEIESFDDSNDLQILPIFLRSNFEEISISQRADIMSEIYEEAGFTPLRLSMKSNSKIEEMLLMTFYLDMVSVELATLRGVDPARVHKITKLKDKLRKSNDRS
ncbi:MAG: bifunctional phosphoglucose/phosphomannose isomerase [Candidatus Thorarchaeota archaeon]